MIDAGIFLQHGWHADDLQVLHVDELDCRQDDAVQVRQLLIKSRDIDDSQLELTTVPILELCTRCIVAYQIVLLDCHITFVLVVDL